MKQHLIHHGRNHRCLYSDSDWKELFVATCNDQSERQRWKFDYYNQTALFRWNQAGDDEF